MTEVHCEAFSFEGLDYQIVVSTREMRYVVQAYRDGVLANGYEHSVRWPTNIGLWKVYGYEAVKDLIAACKKDIEERTWEKYLAAVKKHEEEDAKRQAAAGNSPTS